MEAKHTPGPWELKRTPSRIEVRTDPMHSYAFSLPDEANARLIAAAPDLLTAAQKAIEALELWPETDWGWREREVFDLLSAAIARATEGR